MSVGGGKPAEGPAVGTQYLALQALCDLSRDVLDIVAEQESSRDYLNVDEAFEQALLKRSYTVRELLEIQIMATRRVIAIAEKIKKQQYLQT